MDLAPHVELAHSSIAHDMLHAVDTHVPILAHLKELLFGGAAVPVAFSSSAASSSLPGADHAVGSSAAWEADSDGPSIEPRFVQYYSAANPLTKFFAPIWENAKHEWMQEHGNDPVPVKWMEKECNAEGWTTDKDPEECGTRHIHGFPTVRFYPGDGSPAIWYANDRKKEALIDFVKVHSVPSVREAAKKAVDLYAAMGADSDGPRFVEYFSVSCPHCKKLAPIWEEAKHQWTQEHDDEPLPVKWTEKECYAENWTSGKDQEECGREDIQSFPSVKFYPGGGSQAVDFTGEQSKEALVDFVKTHSVGTKLVNAILHGGDSNDGLETLEDTVEDWVKSHGDGASAAVASPGGESSASGVPVGQEAVGKAVDVSTASVPLSSGTEPTVQEAAVPYAAVVCLPPVLAHGPRRRAHAEFL